MKEDSPRDRSENENKEGVSTRSGTKKRKRLTRQGTMTFEECANLASGSFDRGPGSQSTAFTLSVPETTDHTRMRTTTGSSGIYGVPDHVITPRTSPAPRDSDRPHGKHQRQVSSAASEDATQIRNYRIKSIRRGIPDIITTDMAGRNVRLVTRELEVSNYCVCKRACKEKKSALAWTFSVFVAVVCVISPMLSFIADVTFYVICSDHYNHTASLMTRVRDPGQHFPSAFVTEEDLVTSSRNDVKHSEVLALPPVPLIAAEHVLRHKKNKQSADNYESGGVVGTLYNECDENKSEVGVDFSGSLCRNMSAILAYMETQEALSSLEEHRRVTMEVFEPVFIIGSFPSLLLSIFTRLVVMVTWHDHFISAYVINMAVMPLQLVTGALGVHSASYHMGEFGFSCWECAVAGDCRGVGDAWMDNDLNRSLLAALISKIIDGAAGGCMLFLVLTRVLWRDHGHVTFWWYVGRILLCVASFLMCVGVSALLVLTPAIGVLRLELIQQVPNFDGKPRVEFILTTVLVMGLSTWCVSLCTLLIYLIYRSYVYCRMREHATRMDAVDF